MATKTYGNLTPGEYSANMGGKERVVTVTGETYTTDNVDEQDYFESVLARTPIEQKEPPKTAKAPKEASE